MDTANSSDNGGTLFFKRLTKDVFIGLTCEGPNRPCHPTVELTMGTTIKPRAKRNLEMPDRAK